MIATIIPSILMTLIMFATRLKSYHEVVVMGFPSLLVVLYGFLGMTVSPARLYDEVTSEFQLFIRRSFQVSLTFIQATKSKTCLCLNHSIWHPYRPEVYQLALALDSHLVQPNMGVTIWGFAMLTKPLILAVIISNLEWRTKQFLSNSQKKLDVFRNGYATVAYSGARSLSRTVTIAGKYHMFHMKQLETRENTPRRPSLVDTTKEVETTRGQTLRCFC
ncbi:unnamed protein product [Nippostrongylus brasiliensis]|uniref:ABC transmembrane type-1 domain-containing protein n=1 Tax=Nippostrongylus brasiliensis TaxID=27835 RepID=A0A0N4XMS4_NIPBR|nr:unnamed protein product [Nippostrongylus brasiliensis]